MGSYGVLGTKKVIFEIFEFSRAFGAILDQKNADFRRTFLAFFRFSIWLEHLVSLYTHIYGFISCIVAKKWVFYMYGRFEPFLTILGPKNMQKMTSNNAKNVQCILQTYPILLTQTYHFFFSNANFTIQ